MSKKVEIAKKKLHLNKIKILKEEKEIKIIEHEEMIDRIKNEMIGLDKNIETINEQLNELME